MSVQIEKLEKNMVKLTIEVPAEEFDAATDRAYKKNRGKIAVQGFRKGKAPRAVIEKMYGAGIFYEDAANEIIPDAYAKAVEDEKIDVVAQPEIDVTQVGKGENLIFTALVAVKPEVTLGEYMGIEVEKQEAEVTEEELTAEIDRIREQNARMVTVEDRASQMGDIVVIDYEGSIDGVPFDGGTAQNHELTLGSKSFIDTFEDQLVGKNVGDEVEVNVTFPEEYHAEKLKGKPALFKVKVNSIKVKEVPEADDDLAQDVSDFDTIDEYKEDLKKQLLGKKEAELKRAKEEQVVQKIIDNAQMDIPEPMIQSQCNQMVQEFAQRMQSQGLSLEQYMQFTGMTPQKMLEDVKPQALLRIQSRLVLEEIVKAENIIASDEDVEKELENMAAMYQMEIDKLKELIGDTEKEQIALDMAVQKAVDMVVEAAKEV